jgi:hypothetical protein
LGRACRLLTNKNASTQRGGYRLARSFFAKMELSFALKSIVQLNIERLQGLWVGFQLWDTAIEGD